MYVDHGAGNMVVQRRQCSLANPTTACLFPAAIHREPCHSLGISLGISLQLLHQGYSQPETNAKTALLSYVQALTLCVHVCVCVCACGCACACACACACVCVCACACACVCVCVCACVCVCVCVHA